MIPLSFSNESDADDPSGINNYMIKMYKKNTNHYLYSRNKQ